MHWINTLHHQLYMKTMKTTLPKFHPLNCIVEVILSLGFVHKQSHVVLQLSIFKLKNENNSPRKLEWEGEREKLSVRSDTLH